MRYVTKFSIGHVAIFLLLPQFQLIAYSSLSYH